MEKLIRYIDSAVKNRGISQAIERLSYDHWPDFTDSWRGPLGTFWWVQLCKVNSAQGTVAEIPCKAVSIVTMVSEILTWQRDTVKLGSVGGKKIGAGCFLGGDWSRKEITRVVKKEHLKIVTRSHASPVSSAACWVVLHLMNPAWVRTSNQTCKHTMQISNWLLQ